VFITSHVYAGAVVGALAEDRVLPAFWAGFFSHLAMDGLPHYGDARLTLADPEILRMARIDGTLGLASLLALAATAPPPRGAVLAGMAGACVLDVDKPAQHFLGVNPLPRWLDRFHKWMQNEAPDRMSNELVAGAALAAAAWLVLRRTR